MAKEFTDETYGGPDQDIGPILNVTEDRHGGARFVLEVGYWGIMLRLESPEIARLHTQLETILAGRKL